MKNSLFLQQLSFDPKDLPQTLLTIEHRHRDRLNQEVKSVLRPFAYDEKCDAWFISDETVKEKYQFPLGHFETEGQAEIALALVKAFPARKWDYADLFKFSNFIYNGNK